MNVVRDPSTRERALPLQVSEEVGHWLAGFTDGEGCFYIDGPHIKGGYRCAFVIKVRGDDKPLLDAIVRELGIGRVQPVMQPDRSPQAAFVVNVKHEVDEIRQLFERFPLRSKKSRDFAIWARAVESWLLHQRSEHWNVIAECKRELQAVRRYQDTNGAPNPLPGEIEGSKP